MALSAEERAVDLARVRAGLATAEPAPDPPVITTRRRAAVLIPLFEESDAARVVLTRRAAGLASHRGEVAFPGGLIGPGESELDAALREAEEEVGLEPAAVSVVGRLARVATPTTGFLLTPFVGALPGRPLLQPRPDEVELVFDVSLERLLDPAIYREERWDRPSPGRPVYFFELEHDTVWGVTARILHRLLCLVTGTRGSPG